jgi:hypothetical protein
MFISICLEGMTLIFLVKLFIEDIAEVSLRHLFLAFIVRASKREGIAADADFK